MSSSFHESVLTLAARKPKTTNTLIRYYWDQDGAFVATDDSEFCKVFDELVMEFGFPDRIRIGPRIGVSQDFLAWGPAVRRDDSVCDSCGHAHNCCSCAHGVGCG